MAQPTLNLINSQMNKADKKYSFDIESIDRQINATQLTKLGEQLFLYRKKIEVRTKIAPYVIKSIYFIADINGNIVGKVLVQNNGLSNQLEIDYFIKPEFQGRGIATVALATVIDDIFFDKEFDNIPYKRNGLQQEESRTTIQSLSLSINTDNIASKNVALRNGFKQVDETTWTMTINDYNISHNITNNQDKKTRK